MDRDHFIISVYCLVSHHLREGAVLNGGGPLKLNLPARLWSAKAEPAAFNLQALPRRESCAGLSLHLASSSFV